VAGEETLQLLLRIVPLHYGVANVGPVEAGDELARFFQAQAVHDLVAGGFVRRGREGDAGYRGEALVQYRELDVFRPEVVAPLGHAVGFVNGEQSEAALFVKLVEQTEEALGEQALRGDVKQVEAAGHHGPLGVHRGGEVQAGIEIGGFDAGLEQGVHLVLHQGDQGRDDDGAAGPEQGGNLVAERLAAAGGHQHQGVAALGYVVYDGRLFAAEGAVTENAVEDVQRGVGCGCTAHGCGCRGRKRQPAASQRRALPWLCPFLPDT